MRPEATFEIICADLTEDWIQRIDGDAALLSLQLIRQIYNRDSCIVSSTQEEGDGKALHASWRCNNTVYIRPHESIGGKFKQFSRIDNKSPWTRGHQSIRHPPAERAGRGQHPVAAQ